MKTKELLTRLKADGWELKSHKSSSHMQFTHPTKKGKVTVKKYKSDIPAGTLNSIYKQAGWK